MSARIFKQFDAVFQSRIKAGFAAKGLNASGKTANSLRAEISDTRYVLYGAAHIQESEKGRGKNKQNTGGLFKAIYDWLQYKKYGITYSSDKQRMGIAYAITKTIAEKGSYRFRNAQSRTSIIEQALKAARPLLLDGVIETEKQTQLTMLKDVLKLMKNT